MLDTILVPVDGSDNSLRALDFAMELGKEHASSIRVVHVDIPYDLSRIINKIPSKDDADKAKEVKPPSALDFAKKEAADFGYEDIKFRELIATDAAERICEEAETVGAKMVVMGSRGSGLLVGLVMGSVSMKVSQTIKCPLTIVK